MQFESSIYQLHSIISLLKFPTASLVIRCLEIVRTCCACTLEGLDKSLSCSAFKLHIPKNQTLVGVGVPPALNIEFKCATA